jgi:hypothetical protein
MVRAVTLHPSKADQAWVQNGLRRGEAVFIWERPRQPMK